MSQKPNISIIMASYNHAAFIGHAIESILQQDFDAWELLIADDASTDDTLDVLRIYSKDPRIRILPFTNNREHHMRNTAAQQAHGEYIAFLNSDDLYYPGKLRKQVTWLEQSPRTAAVFSHVYCIDEKGNRLIGHPLETTLSPDNLTPHQWLRHFFFSGNRLCISSAVLRRNCFVQAGAFNPLLIQMGDMDLWIKLCLLKKTIHVIPEPLTAMRILDDNLSKFTPATQSRLVLEGQEVYAQYFSPSAIEQFSEIFPELLDTLPEDSFAWRYYLLCRTGSGERRKSIRCLVFKKLHELLKNQDITHNLQQKNRRLLRTLFLSEGTADLHNDSPKTAWNITLCESSDPAQQISLLSYHTDSSPQGTVCLSLVNPGTAGRLLLSLTGRARHVECRSFRLYNQETAELIFSTDAGRPSFTFDGSLCYPFPEIDFNSIPSKWIDLEIDRAPLALRNRARRFQSRVGRKLLKKTQPILKKP